MNSREILIANTKTQKKCKLNTDATTLGELKAAMDAANIDYDGMSFTEGLSNTELLDDNSQLPNNVKYKGKVTNNLFILLTNTKKNIASGAEDRASAYSLIRDNALQEAVKEEFGKNFTLVTTAELWDFIHDHLDIEPEEEEEEEHENEEDDEEEMLFYPEETDYSSAALNNIYDLIKNLVKMDDLNWYDIESFADLLQELAGRLKEEAGIQDDVQLGNITLSGEDIAQKMVKA